MMQQHYPRDLIGYGRHAPHPRWPCDARIAVQFVLNYEEGAETSVLHGDAASEQFLSEIIGAAAYPARHLSMESIYEYGSRVGVWRILREFERRGLPLTVFGVAMALERHPELTAAFVDLGHEIASHGWRWIHYQNIDEATEREHLERAVDVITRLTGQPPQGWYTGRDSPNTRRLVVDHGGFSYDSDYYGDDLPFWMQVTRSDGATVPHLVVPYTLDANDMRFATLQGFNTGEHLVDPQIAALTDAAADGLTALGHAVTRAQRFDVAEAVNQRWSLLSQVGLAWLVEHPRELSERPFDAALFGAAMQANLETGRAASARTLFDLLIEVERLRGELSEVFDRYDLLLTPAAAALPWPASQTHPTRIAGRDVGPRGHAVFTAFANAAGLPAIALPCGFMQGLPVGMQLVAPEGGDDVLLAVARQWERAHPWRWFPDL